MVNIQTLLIFFSKQRKKSYFLFFSALVVFALAKPQQFTNLWLTADQQGQLLFTLKKYDLAAQHYSDGRWQAYSYYGAENFTNSANLYNQFTSDDDNFARANALAHGRHYIKARNLYQQILSSPTAIQKSTLKAAEHNLLLVQRIIDDINRFSESQKSDSEGSAKELGDEPQTSDGAEQKMVQQVIEQFSAEQLLLDPALNQMWLRQVQKNPARFLSKKFTQQYQRENRE